MLNIRFEENPMMEVILEPEKELNKIIIFDEPEARKLLNAKVRIGSPNLKPLTIEKLKDYEELRHFVECKANKYRYDLLKLQCSFKADPDEPFDRAWLNVSLCSNEEGGIAEQPTAWSMFPEQLFESSQIQQNFTLGPKLKLGLPEIGGIELGYSMGNSHQYERKNIILEALNEGCSDPVWEFAHCEQRIISGKYRLAMVIRSIPWLQTSCNIELKALVKRRKFGIIPYRALFEGKPSLSVPLI